MNPIRSIFFRWVGSTTIVYIFRFYDVSTMPRINPTKTSVIRYRHVLASPKKTHPSSVRRGLWIYEASEGNGGLWGGGLKAGIGWSITLSLNGRKRSYSRWWQLKYFLCSTLLGEDEPILTNMFQMGWNHQPVLEIHPFSMKNHDYGRKG